MCCLVVILTEMDNTLDQKLRIKTHYFLNTFLKLFKDYYLGAFSFIIHTAGER